MITKNFKAAAQNFKAPVAAPKLDVSGLKGVTQLNNC